jgi:predicted nucleotidyltransferase
MMRIPPDFRDFLRLLNEHEVEYLLIGGYAVGYHGYPRATADMDVWVAVNPRNADRLVATLRAFGFSASDVSSELFLTENQIIRMGVPPLRLEIATGISGVDFNQCYAGRVEDTLDGVLVKMISLADLKVNKRAAGRHKDLDDLEHLP